MSIILSAARGAKSDVPCFPQPRRVHEKTTLPLCRSVEHLPLRLRSPSTH